MNTWQREHIKRNLGTLVKVTRCDQKLKDVLLAKHLITEEEGDILKTCGEQEEEGSATELNELYNILLTRSNGYIGFMNCLKESQQTETYEILLEGCKQSNVLDELAKELISLQLELSGRRNTMTDIFPDFSMEDAMKTVKSEEMNMPFISFMNDKQKILKLDQDEPTARRLYISRSVSNRRLLDPKVFELDCVDVFLFKGMSIYELSLLLGDKDFCQSKAVCDHTTCRFILLEDDDDLENLSQNSNAPTHLIYKEGDNHVLLWSTQATEVILKYSTNPQNSADLYVSQEDLVQHILRSQDGGGVLLCDHPGMGKTWLMESITLSIREQLITKTKGITSNDPERQTGIHKSTVVLWVPLSPLSKHLDKQQKSACKESPIRTILQHAYSSDKFAASFTAYFVEIGLMQAIFVLDGFDEVPQNLKEHTIFFLTSLFHEVNVKMVISSRICDRSELEKAFNLHSYDILPFWEREQIEAIVSEWKDSVPESKYLALRALANQCIGCCKRMRMNDDRNILGIPLKCYILAVVNEKYAIQVSKPNRNKPIQISDQGIVQSALELYDKFVETSLDKLDINAATKQNVLNFHQLKALELLFPEIAETYATRHELQRTSTVYKSTMDLVVKAGIIFYSNAENFNFLHRTFAEFFAGNFFSNFWKNQLDVELNFTFAVGTYFIEKTLSTLEADIQLYTEEIYFNDMDSYADKRNKKILEFTNSSVLWFMDMNMLSFLGPEPTGAMNTIILNFRKSLQLLPANKTICKKTTSLVGRLYGSNVIKEHLRGRLYFCLLACIEEQFTSIFGLVIQLANMFFEPYEIEEILEYRGVRDISRADHAAIPLLLNRQAKSRSVETSSQLIRLLGKSFLLKFCSTFPEQFYSPLEVAIDVNDKDMVAFFIKILKLPLERLMIRCLLGSKMNAGEISSRAGIVETIFGLQTLKKHNASLDDITLYLSSLTNYEHINLKLLMNFAGKNKITLHHLPHCCKLKLLRDGLIRDRDIQFVQTIQLLFHNQLLEGFGYVEPSDEKNGADPDKMSELLIQKVIDALDIPKKRSMLLGLTREEVPFQYLHSVETLKILTAIWPDFSECNPERYTYLHYAVVCIKIDWVEHLVKSGYDLNQKCWGGSTPLHLTCLCYDWEQTLDMARRLIDGGADLYAKDDSLTNFLHVFINIFYCNNMTEEAVTHMIRYSFKKGFQDLWSAKNSQGISALDILIMGGYKHPVLDKLKSLLGDSTTKSFNSVWLNILTETDEQIIFQLLLNEFGKEVQNVGISLDNQTDFGAICETDIMDMLDIGRARKSFATTYFFVTDMLFPGISVKNLNVLIAICPDFSLRNLCKQNYLHIATIRGNCDCIKTLINVGQDVNQRDMLGCTPLHLPGINALPVTRLLLEAGADINLVNSQEENIVHTYIKRIREAKEIYPVFDWFSFILDNGYDYLFHMKDIHGKPAIVALIELLKMNSSRTTERYALEAKLLLYIFNEDFRTNMSLYCDKSKLQTKTLERLVFKNKIDLWNLDTDQKVAILRGTAYEGTDTQMIQLLLLLFPNHEFYASKFANLRSKMKSGQKHAEKCESEGILELLRTNEARMCFEKLSLGKEKLLKNIELLETLKVLFGICPDFTHCNKLQLNYMHIATCRGLGNWIEYLVEVGSDITQQDIRGRTPFHFLPSNDNGEVIELLLSTQCEVQKNKLFNFLDFMVNNCDRIHGDKIKREWLGYAIWMDFTLKMLTNEPRITSIQETYEYIISECGEENELNECVFDAMNAVKAKHGAFETAILFGDDSQLIEQLHTQCGLTMQVLAEYDGTLVDRSSEASLEIEYIQLTLPVLKSRVVFHFLCIDTNSIPFRCIHELSTLKLLANYICPNFNRCNIQKWNYLHIATWHERLDWVQYLVEKKYDVNERDSSGSTPLHYIYKRKPVELTKLLVKSGANIYALSNWNRNVAHRFLAHQKLNKVNWPFPWVTYTLENEYDRLWDMIDIHGNTPIELLLEMALALDPAKLIAIETKTLLFIFNETFRTDMKTYYNRGQNGIDFWKNIIFNHGISLNHVDEKLKLGLLRGTLLKGTDLQTVTLLLLLFPKQNLEGSEAIFTAPTPEVTTSDFHSEEILELIDKSLAKRHLANLSFHGNNLFPTLRNTETLRILHGIDEYFFQSPQAKVSYLHMAVGQGNIDGVKFLIEVGYDVNQLDENKSPPIHFVTPSIPLDITKLLVENGAKLHFLNNRNNNVVQRFLRHRDGEDTNRIVQWTDYMLQQNCDPIWATPDNLQYPDESPYVMLSECLGTEHPTTKAVLSRLLPFDQVVQWGECLDDEYCWVGLDQQSETALSQSDKAGLTPNLCWDERIVSALLRLFGKCAGEKCKYERVLPPDSAGLSSDSFQNAHNFIASDILGCLDLCAARVALSNRYVGNLFWTKVDNLETLKILIGIFQDFTNYNAEKANYLHFAVRHMKKTWVEYLISSGHDVNQRDKKGSTPLHYLSIRNPLDVARLLIQGGCDPLIANTANELFLDKLARRSRLVMKPIPDELKAYLIDNMFEIYCKRFKNIVKHHMFETS